MKATLVYIWLISMILPTFSQWGTIAYYQVNKDYITRVLCENRDKPQLHCEGHCYLAKKLKNQEQKKDQETSEQVRNLPSLNLFSSPLHHFVFLSEGVFLKKKCSFHYRRAAYQAPLPTIALPPCA